ncbi:long-chain fatty acid transport protein [Modicisalibacter ilicicola DSM 19980]|uniref:Long-chain fatty acid transport protein n=1 Tax=Modicisalibacter ilicicola DSM 19980 TaxID=1121942 RepID=A0A1M5F4B6_9GAMM|nr:TonB-dependent receptor [Halomonas ilicicola]SHF86367.1 long-chain fatty acid transport protein [Halomonas ilicicola DSM 19980]
MQNKINKLSLAIATTAAALSSQAMAGGFQLNEQSVSGQGYSHAGRSSNVQDATIVFGNPAGMSFLDRAQITGGATYLNVNSDIDNVEYETFANTPVGPAPGALGPVTDGTNDGDMVPGTAVPFAFYAQPLSERVHFGFGVYAPFGSKTDYEDTFEGRYFGNYTEVRVISAQPTLSYKINDQLAIGAGVTYNQVEGELRRQLPGDPSFNPENDTDARVDGDDEAWGYNIGVIYRPVPETTLGLTYRSKVDYTLEGDFEAIAPGGNIVRADDATLDLTTPETVNFSVTQQMTDRLELMFGASWARWSRFERILVEGSQGNTITNEPQNYSNAWNYAVGAQYQLNPQWVLRTGLALDNTPTNDEDRSVRIPSDDRRIFSLGAGWTPIPDLTIDLAYSYLTERGTEISQSRNDSLDADGPDGPAPALGGVNYSADYKNEAHGFGAQATYRF